MPCSFVNSVTDRLTGALALAAAVLSAVLVASKLPSDLHVVGGAGAALMMPLSHRPCGWASGLDRRQSAKPPTLAGLQTLGQKRSHVPRRRAATAAHSLVHLHACRPQFAHVLFSLELFLLSPFVRRYVRAASSAAHIATTAAMAFATAALVAALSHALALVRWSHPCFSCILYVKLAHFPSNAQSMNSSSLTPDTLVSTFYCAQDLHLPCIHPPGVRFRAGAPDLWVPCCAGAHPQVQSQDQWALGRGCAPHPQGAAPAPLTYQGCCHSYGYINNTPRSSERGRGAAEWGSA